MILHMRHTLWNGISEANVNVITSATRAHALIITPSNFAYSTVSTRLPSMTMLGIECLTLSSGEKQITISFDFLS